MIKTWTEVAARVRLYMLTSDLTSLVPPQFTVCFLFCFVLFLSSFPLVSLSCVMSLFRVCGKSPMSKRRKTEKLG